MSNGITKRQSKDGIGVRVSRIETISHGRVNLERVGFLQGLTAGEIENFRLRPGDVLFSHINSDIHLGKTAIYTLDGELLLHGMNLLLLRPDEAAVIPQWLHWLFNHYRSAGHFIDIAQHAVNQSSINQAKLKALEIPLPPLDVQHLIVDEIEKQFSRIDAGVAALKRVEASLKRYRAAVLKAACEGWLCAGGQPESIESNREWKTLKIEDACDRIVDCLHSTAKFAAVGRYCLDTTWIKPGKIIYEKARCVDDATFDDRNRRMRPSAGDVVFSREGTIGVAVALPSGIDVCLGQRMMVFRLKDSVHPSFFEAYLNSDTFKAHYKKDISGSVSPHLNISSIRNYPIRIPPIDAQETIVNEIQRRLSVVEEVEAAVSANLKRACRLQQAVLQKAFSEGASE